MKEKVTVPFEIQSDQRDWLEAKAEAYNLANADKALRVLLDFAMQDGDDKTIFETIRCTRC